MLNNYRISASDKMDSKHNKNMGLMHKTNISRLEGGEKSDWLEALEPKQQYGDKFPVFFLSLIYSQTWS